jgi:hypothetical protein
VKAKLTVITNSNGPLTKRGWQENGRLCKDASRCTMSHGTARQVEIPLTPSAIADLLNKIGPCEAIAIGITGHKEVKIVTKRELRVR